MTPCLIALDLGGTWMKGCAALPGPAGTSGPAEPLQKRHNPLRHTDTAEAFAQEIVHFCRHLAKGRPIGAVVASTAGEVDPAGKRYICAGEHLGVMASTPWADLVHAALDAPFKLINDAEAFLLGAATHGLVDTRGNTGCIVIGTGLGFAMARKGRWWKPFRRLIHLGAILTPAGDYNALVSAVNAAAQGAFQSDSPASEAYFQAVASTLASAINLLQIDTLLLGGGVVDACNAAGIPLVQTLSPRIPPLLLPGVRAPRLVAVENGNQTILDGVLALAAGDLTAEPSRFTRSFATLSTETAGNQPTLETLPAEEITRYLAADEAAAATRYESSVPQLAHGATLLAAALQRGGRIIYLGAGTSGRIGALDAVEIPCTFGLRDDRFIAVIAGGSADAAFTIEDQFEEDLSSVPELLLLNPGPNDLVIGLSASGSAFFVRSGLAYARSRGAVTLFLHEGTLEKPLADLSIPLGSGSEAIAGSTRMKAGTATKKALNHLSTTAMILLGKVCHGEMIDLHCWNAKLQERALRILMKLGSLSREEAIAQLTAADYHLRTALDHLGSTPGK